MVDVYATHCMTLDRFSPTTLLPIKLVTSVQQHQLIVTLQRSSSSPLYVFKYLWNCGWLQSTDCVFRARMSYIVRRGVSTLIPPKVRDSPSHWLGYDIDNNARLPRRK